MKKEKSKKEIIVEKKIVVDEPVRPSSPKTGSVFIFACYYQNFNICILVFRKAYFNYGRSVKRQS